MAHQLQFQPFEILCLRNEDTCVYTEVIQIIPERQLCWARPLAMVIYPDHSEEGSHQADKFILYDLRQGVDLLCPLTLFQIALDIEVIPILAKLEALKAESQETGTEMLEVSQTNHHHLQQFIHRLWRTHPDAFRT